MDSKIFLGKYRVAPEEIEAVGGPPGSVLTYAAEEIDSGRKLMIEVVPAASLKASARERLEVQALTAKALNHPNIAALYDFGVQNDHLIYVTKDVEGTTAEEWVRTNGPLPVGPVLRIASQVVSALSAAAFHGIVHRAISPSNLVLVPGQTAQGEWPLVKVLHFVGGASKIPGSDVAVAAFDKSTLYASPEQREHGTVDFRSQIYSLGSTMCFLLNGAPPLMTPNGTRPTSPPKTKTALPEKVGGLLAQMLSTNPGARPPDPVAFYRMLQDCVNEAEGREAPVRASRRPVPRSNATKAPSSRRFPFKSLVRAAICLALAAVAALVLREYRKQPQIVHAEQPAKAPIGVTDALVSAKPADPTVSLAPKPTEAVANPRSVTTNTVESVSQNQITSTRSLTTSDPEESPPRKATNPIVTINASDPRAARNAPAVIDSPEAVVVAQLKIAPAPSRDAEVSAAVWQSPPKEIKMPEVRRAEPADEPEVRRAELARLDGGPALVLKRTDPIPEVAPTSRAEKTERPAKPSRPADEKIYLLPGHEFEAPPATGRLPRGSVRGRFVGETADGKWMFELPSREIVTVRPPSSPP